MSNSESRPPPPPPPPAPRGDPPRLSPVAAPRHRRNGCLTALMITLGVILLLPGICGVILAGLDPHELTVDPTMLLAVLGLIAVGGGGIVLIWLAVRRPRG